ncbi:MAG: hypothetical protein JXA57_17890 [Armatimonadetes bacterium]|nr:hypothetical protein [Armatimonadota bacterium]
MNEGLAFSFIADEAYDRDDARVPDAFARQVIDDLRGLGVSPGDLELKTGSAGYGADALTIIAAITGVIALPVAVRDSATVLIGLGKRIGSAVSSLQAKYQGVSISEPAAFLLAVVHIAESLDLDGEVILLDSQVIPIRNSSLEASYESDFRYHPDRFYVFTLQDSRGDAYVVAMRSNGVFEFVRRLPSGNWLEYSGFE